MADAMTVARPYARALFEYALAESQLEPWAEVLTHLATLGEEPQVLSFLANPSVTQAEQVDLLLAVLPASTVTKEGLQAFLSVLAENKRLHLFFYIKHLFDILLSEQEKKLSVTVRSFSPLSSEQKTKLAQALSQRFQRQVNLQMHIEPSLLGGAVIEAGDLVIDGSVLGKLNQLRASLAA